MAKILYHHQHPHYVTILTITDDSKPSYNVFDYSYMDTVEDL